MSVQLALRNLRKSFSSKQGSFGADNDVFLKVVMPFTLPYVISTFRINIGFGLVAQWRGPEWTAVAAEIGADVGTSTSPRKR